MSRSFLAAAALFTLALAGCAGGGFSDADRAAVQSAWDAIASADVAADWDALSPYVADDFVHMDARGDAVRGKDNWRTWVEGVEFGGGEGAYIVEEIDGNGDMAYVIWRYEGTYVRGGQRRDAPSKGISIFRRQADGSWAISRNAWNTTPSPIEGVWRATEAWGILEGEEWRTESIQPSLYIFHEGYYSISYVDGDEPRPLLPEDATREAISNTQMRSTFMTFISNSGTYTLDGSSLTTTPIVALWPNFMTGGTGTFTFAAEPNRMELRQTFEGGERHVVLERLR